MKRFDSYLEKIESSLKSLLNRFLGNVARKKVGDTVKVRGSQCGNPSYLRSGSVEWGDGCVVIISEGVARKVKI